MRYTAILDGEERIVEVTPAANGYRVAIGDKVLEVDAVHLKADALGLIVGKLVFDIPMEINTYLPNGLSSPFTSSGLIAFRRPRAAES